MDLHERFWSKVAVAQCWECWDWLGAGSRDGYGKCSHNGVHGDTLPPHPEVMEIDTND